MTWKTKARARLVAYHRPPRQQKLPPPAIAPATAPVIAPIKIEPTPGWRKRREELRRRGLPANWRGRLGGAPPAIARVAPAIAPLSPIEILDPRGEVAPAIAPPATPPGAHPLPDDWQPTAGRRANAAKRLGEVRAAFLTEKFRTHFHARAHEIRTAAGWQGRYDNWVLSEHTAAVTPQLPLLRAVEPAARPDDKWEIFKRAVHAVPRRQSG
jgi:hypothetical protein